MDTEDKKSEKSTGQDETQKEEESKTYDQMFIQVEQAQSDFKSIVEGISDDIKKSNLQDYDNKTQKEIENQLETANHLLEEINGKIKDIFEDEPFQAIVNKNINTK